MYVLGIDGGGTKTTGVIATEKGEKIAEVVVGSSNLNTRSKTIVETELFELLSALKNQNPVVFKQIQHVFAGFAGAANQSHKEILQGILTARLAPNTSITVDNDAVIALYSGTLGKPGIVQIAGTGSITYGITKDGERDRIGGWGHLFSDHGSGYAIGRDGLCAAFSAYDSEKDDTYLIQLLLQLFNRKKLPEIIQDIYQADNHKSKIASLSRLVIEAVDHGDVTAKSIVEKNAKLLGESISTMIQKRFKAESIEPLPVVLAGGLFDRYDLFKTTIEKTINENNSNVEIVIPRISPVGGAVIAALQQEGIEVSESFCTVFNGLAKSKGVVTSEISSME